MKYLPRALETLRTQQHVRTEIIVVDRESADGSREYLTAASPRWRTRPHGRERRPRRF
jgi:glycosyltransferase involved in cell wall biosynthesis